MDSQQPLYIDYVPSKSDICSNKLTTAPRINYLLCESRKIKLMKNNRKCGLLWTITFKVTCAHVIIILLASTVPASCFNATVSTQPTNASLLNNVTCKCFNETARILASDGTLVMVTGYYGLTTSCIDVGLTSLPLHIPSQTRTLLLDRNRIRALGDAIVNASDVSYTGVKTLSLRFNELREVGSLAFQQFQSLSYLLLSNNLVKDLLWTSGLSDVRLTHLDVSSNSIPQIKTSDFEQLMFLEWLDLSHNHIKNIESLSFATLSDLKVLDLSSNFITINGLCKDALDGMSSLTHLSFAGNRALNNLPDFGFAGLEPSSLISLDLHGLPFVINVQSRAFWGMVELRELNLSYCSISTLQQGWLNGGPRRTLKTLDLSHNAFVGIRANYLVAADVWRSRSSLDLPKLKPDELPYLVSPSDGIDNSDISHVKFSDYIISSAEATKPADLHSLTWLSFSDNPRLSYIEDDAFTHLPNLQYLFLQSCNISRLTIASAKNRYANNAISSTLPHLRALWAYDNPLVCDCHIRAVNVAASSSDNSSHERRSNCQDNTADSTNTSNVLLLDPGEYYYEDRCFSLKSAELSVCFIQQSREYWPIDSVSSYYLTCTEEPMSLFIAMMIGPIAFAASISLVMICGWCTVLVHRIKRYKSGAYHFMDEQQALRERDAPNKDDVPSTRRRPRRKYDHPASSSPYTQSRRSYGTNLVLGNMSVRHPSGHVELPFFDSLLSISRSRSPSPTRSQDKRRSDKKSSVEREAPSCGIQLQVFKKSVVVDSHMTTSSSCPNICDVSVTESEYWRHAVPTSSNRTPSNHTVDAISSVEKNNIIRYIDEDDSAAQSETGFLLVPGTEALPTRENVALPREIISTGNSLEVPKHSNIGHTNGSKLRRPLLRSLRLDAIEYDSS